MVQDGSVYFSNFRIVCSFCVSKETVPWAVCGGELWEEGKRCLLRDTSSFHVFTLFNFPSTSDF